MTEVFIKKEDKVETGFNLGVLLGLPNNKLVKGDVGLEIEVEGNKFPIPTGAHGTHHPTKMTELPGKTSSLPGWCYVHDGSLRGKANAEYVFDGPAKFDQVEKRVTDLFDLLKEYGSVLDDSNRTSVHVHMNVQNFHLDRLASFLGLYFCFEEILTQWCGEHRVGNLFCLRAIDAPAIISQIRRFIRADGKAQLHDHLHYSALNANALTKHGSLEIRTMRGCKDPETILEWVAILRRLYDVSADFSDPRDVCAGFSGEGALAFFDNILGEHGQIVRRDVNWSDDEVRESMYTGIRLAQDLCYCRDWSLYKGMTLKPDPFSRSAKKVAAAVMGQLNTPAQAPSPLQQYYAAAGLAPPPTATGLQYNPPAWATEPADPWEF